MQHGKTSFSRIIFVEPGQTGNVFHNNVVNGALNIDVRIFALDIVQAAEIWLSQMASNSNFQANQKLLVTRHSSGLPPFLIGFPVIA